MLISKCEQRITLGVIIIMIVDREKNHCVNISILEFLSLGGNSLFFHRSSLWFTNAKLMCSTTQSVEQFLGFSALIFLHLDISIVHCTAWTSTRPHTKFYEVANCDGWHIRKILESLKCDAVKLFYSLTITIVLSAYHRYRTARLDASTQFFKYVII